MASTRFAVLWIAATAVLMLVMSINAPFPDQMRLQHSPTVVILLGMGILAWLGRGSRMSIVCIHLFLWLHIIGARWIYSYVPYDAWSEWLFGSRLSEWFGWKRNHYDRLVHFMSGVLLVPPAFEWLRYRRLRVVDAALLAATVILAMGAVYEIFEWGLAVTMSPERAEAYNGQQGDLWDPQKDLALAGVGAVVSSTLLYLGHRERS